MLEEEDVDVWTFKWDVGVAGPCSRQRALARAFQGQGEVVVDVVVVVMSQTKCRSLENRYTKPDELRPRQRLRVFSWEERSSYRCCLAWWVSHRPRYGSEVTVKDVLHLLLLLQLAV